MYYLFRSSNINSQKEGVKVKKTTYITTRYDIKEGIYVEIVPETDGAYETYSFSLCVDMYDKKTHMFSVLQKDCPPEVWEEMVKNNYRSYLHSKLKDMRRERNLTQRELASLSGINLRMIEYYEQGYKSLNKATGESLLKLSMALGCKVEDLLDL